MGSGHFLVAALDRIEARLSAWLALHPVPAVTDELTRLRNTALQSLGELGVGVDIESSSLIRRQVARHCVYGVDRNRVAVELARLAIWVHTFVPGLPLSFLDHNLVCGDSLTGVGTLDEVVAEFEPDADPTIESLFRTQLEDLLAGAKSALLRLARTSDATKREIDEARAADREAQVAVANARALFDVVTAHRAGVCSLPENYNEVTIIGMSRRADILNHVKKLKPLHFPSAFPEVFHQGQPGFNCVLGNPPWEKLKVEKPVWWGVHEPGIRALPVKQMNTRIETLRRKFPELNNLYEIEISEKKAMSSLIRRIFSLGKGDTDLYHAFVWRFWNLVADRGTIGIVLPRSALSEKGAEGWRRSVLGHGSLRDITVLRNKGGWVFDDLDARYTVALCTVKKGDPDLGTVRLRGPYSRRDEYEVRGKPTRVDSEEFLSWSDTACLPLLPSATALLVF